MSVTDNVQNTREPNESRNAENAKLSGLMLALQTAEGVDTTEEGQAKRSRDREALRTAEICGECGEALGPEATVYRLRYVVQSMFGYGYRMRVLCEGCAYRLKQPMSMRRVLGITPRQPRKCLYAECDTCGRTVVWEESTRDRRVAREYVFCCEHCEKAYRLKARRDARLEVRQKTCEVCGKEFVATRRDAKTCSPACKQKAYRERKKGARVK